MDSSSIFGFWSSDGQIFNNPKCQRWPAIFWPGYTAATLEQAACRGLFLQNDLFLKHQ
jgi:hypothetical protein